MTQNNVCILAPFRKKPSLIDNNQEKKEKKIEI